MSKFDPPKPQSLTPGELVQAISQFGADAAGVAKAVELIQIQDQLKAQDEADLAAWVAVMVSEASDKSVAALRSAGFTEHGVFLGADLAPADISDPMPESESRVENRRVVLETGLEGQFATNSTSGDRLTRHGMLLTSPAAALETATADIATYFQPKSRIVDEAPVLGAGLGLSALFGFFLAGNGEALSLILGFVLGAICSLLLARLGKGFPGIFALTSFGVVGARFLRGMLASASVLVLTTFIPPQFQPSDWPNLEGIFVLLPWAALVLTGTILGLAVSGKKLTLIRSVTPAVILVGVILLGVISSTGFSFAPKPLNFVAIMAGALIAFLLNTTLAFSTTVGAVRFHLVSALLSTIAFSSCLLLVIPNPTPVVAQICFALVGLSVASSFASASTSKGRFWSGLAGVVFGMLLVASILLLPLSSEFTLAFALSLTGAWLTVIGFDSIVRKGRLHLASLNRSFGFYGPVSWLAILVLLFSGFMGVSVAWFSPLAQVVPAVIAAPLLSMLLALVFSLIRLPEIKAQEEEILIAVSRVSAGNQVGFQ